MLLVSSTLTVSLARADAPIGAPDVLVYRDGDRVAGRLVRREDGVLVFKSVHFGELRVAAADAEVVSVIAPAAAGAMAANPAKPAPPAVPAVKSVSATTTPSLAAAPDEMAKFLRRVFGPWHGHIGVSAQVLQNPIMNTDFLVEAKMDRKWTNDQVHLETRYEYTSANHDVTLDLLTANGNWRHALTPRYFTVYRPSVEWNQDYVDDGVQANYLLLQQEVGVGVNVWDTDKRKVRVGVSENFFDRWDLSRSGHEGQHVESLFAEADLNRPWRSLLTERAVFYYAIATGKDGWENQIEVTKKFTQSLSLGMRYEVRYNDPDVESQNYSLLRFFVGFDF